jgi:hypothetical protein
LNPKNKSHIRNIPEYCYLTPITHNFNKGKIKNEPISKTNHKQNKEVISQIIALLFFAILSSAIKAHDVEFNSKLFIGQSENLYLQDPIILAHYRSITNVKKEIDAYAKCKPVFDKYLDGICENIVGNTMLKLMIANAKAKNLPTLLKIEDGYKNQFSPKKNTVYINPNLYEEDGYKISMFYGINREMGLTQKRLTMYDGLFHELCHAFHTCFGKRKSTADYLGAVYAGREEKYLWTYKQSDRKCENDEEMYTITGYYWDSGRCLDPISCNMFDICKHAANPESIVQRMFHKEPAYIQAHTATYTPSYKIDQFLIDVPSYVVDTAK